MSNRRIIGFTFVAVAFALAAVVVRSGITSTPQSDDSGIGGGWKPYTVVALSMDDSTDDAVWEPYTVEAHSKMDGYFQSNGYELVDVSDSQGDSQTYFSSEPSDNWIGLDDSLDVGSIIADLLATAPSD